MTAGVVRVASLMPLLPGVGVTTLVGRVGSKHQLMSDKKL
jgi:hypothetical protein